MSLYLRWFLSRTVRQAFDMHRQVRRMTRDQADLLATGDSKALAVAMDKLQRVANQHLRSHPYPGWHENIEVLLVTGAVVMALRTFFFQPMAIPSGSAQPTLWGIMSEDLRGQPDSVIPRGIDRWIRSAWSGEHYVELKARTSGPLTRVDPPKLVIPFVKKQTLYIGNTPHTLWFPPDDLVARANLRPDMQFRAGEDIVKLRYSSGDHLFVNRMTYNFRHPRRGEIIVFESDHLAGLIQNTHYIKRLVGLPGERVRIGDDRHVVINGQRLDASTPFFENLYSFDPGLPPRKDHYSGHANGTIAAQHGLHPSIARLFPDAATEYRVPDGCYLPFGDNTLNSADGRSWGVVPEQLVIGKAGFVFWPITSRFGYGYR
jgi:signal peptidase I